MADAVQEDEMGDANDATRRSGRFGVDGGAGSATKVWRRPGPMACDSVSSGSTSRRFAKSGRRRKWVAADLPGDLEKTFAKYRAGRP